MNQKYTLYWIRLFNHTDIYSQGYVGITNNLANRMKQHFRASTRSKVSACIRRHSPENIVVDVIVSDLEHNQALILEEMVRPSEMIGWNVLKGGHVDYRRKRILLP